MMALISSTRGLVVCVCLTSIALIITISLYLNNSIPISSFGKTNMSLTFNIPFTSDRKAQEITILRSSMLLNLVLLFVFLLGRPGELMFPRSCFLLALLVLAFILPDMFLLLDTTVHFFLAELFIAFGSIVLLDKLSLLQRTLKRIGSVYQSYAASFSFLMSLFLLALLTNHLHSISPILSVLQFFIWVFPMLLPCYFSSVVSVNWLGTSLFAIFGMTHLLPISSTFPSNVTQLASIAAILCVLLMCLLSMLGNRESILSKLLAFFSVGDDSICRHRLRLCSNSSNSHYEEISSTDDVEFRNSDDLSSRRCSEAWYDLLFVCVCFVAYFSVFSIGDGIQDSNVLWQWLSLSGWWIHWFMYYLSFYQRSKLYQAYYHIKEELLRGGIVDSLASSEHPSLIV